AVEKTLDYVIALKLHCELVARKPRLPHYKFGCADSKPIADIDFILEQPFDCEVLAECAEGQFDTRQLAAPVVVVLDGINVHGLVRPTVYPEVCLPVTGEVQGI